MKNILTLCIGSLVGVFLFSSCMTSKIGGIGPYGSKAYKPNNPDAVKVKVSLANQAVYVMEGSRPLLVTATCVGTPAKPTPKGSFRVYKKIKDKRSYSYGYWVNSGGHGKAGTSGQSPGAGYRYVGYPMPYWVEFSPQYGFHQGWVWPVPRTHGCLRLHHNVAPKFFALVKNGTPVNIAQTQPEDQTLGKGLRRPHDYMLDDPPISVMTSARVFQTPTAPLFESE